MSLAEPLRATRESFLTFGRPEIGEEEIAEVVDSLRAGWIGTGPKVQRFERDLEAYVGVEHVRCVSSCTAALMLGLLALDVGPGDEVIAPTMTFAASVNAVLHAGATPVLVDSDGISGLMDLDAVEAAITARTKAVVAVHLYGAPLDMDRLNAIRDKYGIAIVEDAAHALGAQWQGRQIGSLGNLTAYSFYATKNVTTAEGGALATDDPAVAERIERLSLHGLSAGAWQRYSDSGFKHYEVVELGYKYNMTDLQAALGIHQLRKLDGWIDTRRRLWDGYSARLSGLPVELPPDESPGTRHARHLYPILVAADEPTTRDELLNGLTRHKIGSGVHYRAVHTHQYYRERFGFTPEMFPVASDLSDRTLSLPLSPGVTASDQDDIAYALAATFADSGA
jgi:dTDP-4-amino-4,6-dideoxygalactose transaminase